MSTDKPVGLTVQDDPLWLIAFPVYFLFMSAYGIFAAFYYIPSVHHLSSSPAFAQIFGIVIAVVCLTGFAGSLRTIRTKNPDLELIGQVAVVLTMLIYFISITIAVLSHDPGTRPGSSFVPQVFAVFPLIRIAVITRRRRKNRAYTSQE